MTDALETRASLRRALAVNALTKPVDILVAAAVLAAAAVLDAGWLAVVAALCWLTLAAITFLDEREAQHVGVRRRARRRERAPAACADPSALSPAVGARVRAAMAARAAIVAAIESSPWTPAEVADEVESLVAAIEAQALRAQRIHEFLSARSPRDAERLIAAEANPAVAGALEAQLEALRRLQRRLDELLAEMDHVVASLDAVHANVVAAGELGAVDERRALARRVSDLRATVELASAELEEAFADTRSHVRDGGRAAS